MNQTMTGLDLIQQTFKAARDANRATFMPFFTVGFPDLPTSIQAFETLVAAGADVIEIGIPFSDPLSDGPTNQHASQIALENHIRLADCIRVVRTLRERGVKIPLVLMGYFNPVLSYGLEKYVQDAAQAGASGFIIPDLPMEEAAELNGYCERYGLVLIPMLAPTSTPERIRQVVADAKGFVYLVSVTGVTGTRDSLPPDLAEYVRRVRSLTTLPLVAGFGISQPQHVKTVAGLADGVVVGSALIRVMESQGLEAMRDLAASLRAAC